MFNAIIESYNKIIPFRILVVVYTIWNCVYDILDIFSTGIIIEYIYKDDNRNKWRYGYYVDIFIIVTKVISILLNIISCVIFIKAYNNNNIKSVEDTDYEKNVSMSPTKISKMSSEVFDV